MRFFQVPARKWWWGLIALAAYIAAYALISMAVSPFLMMTFAEDMVYYGTMTPSGFVVNDLINALYIPVCVLLAWLFFRQGFGWVVSVVGRFRWKWFGLTVGIFLVVYAIRLAADVVTVGPEGLGITQLEMQPYTWFMIAAIVIMTPFQSAGEEFQHRVFLPKVVAAIIPWRYAGLVLSAVLPALVFMWAHNAQDLWLNVNYFAFAILSWWLAYRTGGIEASIAFHTVNNLFGLWMMPFNDFTGVFERSAGSSSPTVLFTLIWQLAAVLIIDFVARRHGLVRKSAPAAATPLVLKPETFVASDDQAVPATKADLPRIDTTPRQSVPGNSWAAPTAMSQTQPSTTGPDGLLDDADQRRADAQLGDAQPDQPGDGTGLRG